MNSIMTNSGYPHIDRPWLKYFSERDKNMPLPENSIFSYLRQCSKDISNCTALNYFNNKISYSALLEHVDDCAKALAHCGVKQGDVVSVCMLTVPEAVYLLYGINKLGAISNMLKFGDPEEQIRASLNETKTKVVVTISPMAEAISRARKGTGVRTIVTVDFSDSMIGTTKAAAKILHPGKRSQVYIKWDDFIKAGIAELPAEPDVKADDAAVILYTGGTTGEPKGVVLSNRNLNAVAFFYCNSSGMIKCRKGDTFLDIVPPFLAYGVSFGIHFPAIAGFENILVPDLDPNHFSKFFYKYKPNHFSGGPLHIENMVKHGLERQDNMAFAVTAAYGGDGTNEEWEEKINSFLLSHGANPLMKGYGMTETAATFCTSTHSTKEMLPLPKNNIRIKDIDTGEDLRYGQTGEICVSGPSVMLEYYNNQEATDDVMWEEDGVRWMHTGDLGYVTEEGYFFISGRIKRLLWTVGKDAIPMRVYPMAIEKVLAEHPAIKESTVVGALNRDKGYLAIAYIVLNEDHCLDKTLERELENLCKSRLPAYSVPAVFEVLDELPHTPIGKVDFRALEKLADDKYSKSLRIQ
jgi:long-chain acyl-CoA synthetase